jgi:hypothetical protein
MRVRYEGAEEIRTRVGALEAYLAERSALSEHGVSVIRSIAAELSERVGCETRLNKEDEFSPGGVPPVPLFDYLCRLARYVNIWSGHAGGAESSGVRAALTALVYLERLGKRQFVVNAGNVHRLLMVAFLLSLKFCEDSFLPMSYWAKVGGVPCQELTRLEIRFCALIRFDLFLTDLDMIFVARLAVRQPLERHKTRPPSRTLQQRRTGHMKHVEDQFERQREQPREPQLLAEAT